MAYPTTIESPVPSIQALKFQPMPTKMKGVAAARSSQTIVMRTEKGVLYSNGLENKRSYSLLSCNRGYRVRETLECCVKLNLISKDDLAVHTAAADAEAAKRRLRDDTSEFLDLAEQFGVVLSDEQKNHLASVPAAV